MSVATCRTDGCANADIPIEVGDLSYVDDDTGETYTAGVACGVCGQPITDVSESPPPEVEGTPRDDLGPE
jgi:hypothetical protein